MKIILSPVRMDEALTVTRQGDTLTVNGEIFDFSPLTDGATLPREAIKSDWFCGPAERDGGELVVTLRLPHGANAPESTRFPQPLYMTGDGAVPLPMYDIPASSAAAVESEPYSALILTHNPTGEQYAVAKDQLKQVGTDVRIAE